MMVAWHNDPNLKAKVLARMVEHRAQDSIIQGHYQLYDPELATRFRGCLIGCTLPVSPETLAGFTSTYAEKFHGAMDHFYGIPVPVAQMLDQVFESIPASQAPEFAVSSIEAIPVGADLSRVLPRLMLDILLDRDHGVEWEYGHFLTGGVARLHQVWADYGVAPADEKWREAFDWVQECDVLRNAVMPYSEYLMESVTDLWADQGEGPLEGHIRWLTDTLLSHLRNAPIPTPETTS